MDRSRTSDRLERAEENLAGCRAVVMGLGLHGGGVGVAQYLAAQGAVVTVTDLRDEETLRPSLAERWRALPIRYVLGRHEEEDFQRADLVLRNPAVPLDSPYLTLARKSGARIEMESSLFVKRVPECVSLRGLPAPKARPRLPCCSPRCWTLRVTTWLRPAILRDLDAEPACGDYGGDACGAGAFKLAVGGLCAACLQSAPGRGDERAARPPESLRRHGRLRRRQGDQRAVPGSRPMWPFSTGTITYTRAMGARAPGRVMWFCAQDSIPGEAGSRARGAHLRENIAAAQAAARVWGVDDTAIASVVQSFTGVPHRQELVREWRGIRFINDTTATMPAATVACIEAIPEPKVLLLGGADKRLDFTDLARTLHAHRELIRGIVLLEGSATDRLAAALPLPVAGRYADIAQALDQAVALARSGDAVILSPGCASFGMFNHEFERGEAFCAWIGALPE